MTYVDKVVSDMEKHLNELVCGETTGGDVLAEFRQQFVRSFKNGQRFCPRCNPKSKKSV